MKESKYTNLWQFPKLQAVSISLKPADAIPLTDVQKRTGDGFRQEFGSPALPFAQKRLYLRPQQLNRIHIGVVWRQMPQLYACGVICVVCPRRSAAAFYPAATCEAPRCRFSACVPPYGRQYTCSRRIFLLSPRRYVFFVALNQQLSGFIVQHFAHFSHLPVTYCTTFCCSCQG